MSHQDQLKLQEYRNWVKGGLSFKYFKDGIQQYAEQIALSEHNRILQQAGVSSGQICVACNLREIRPLHKCQPNSITGRSCCPWGQKNCNCHFSTKKKKCPMNICDVIYEEILKSHASAPPSPEWRNTDITKWTTSPWEIAKCYINAPGYSDKQSAADIDIAGLLHLFVNNIEWRQYFPTIDADVFAKMRERRHLLFHSPSTTLETAELNTLINDMISILKVENLKTSKDALNAVQNLNDLKNEDFYITTHCEADVLESIRTDVCNEREEIRTLVEDARHEISTNQEQAVKRIITAQEEGNAEISSKLKQATKDITEQRKQASELITLKREQCINDITSSHKQVIDSITSKGKEIFVKLNEYMCHERIEALENDVANLNMNQERPRKQLDLVQGRLDLRRSLVDFFQKNYVKTTVCPLKPTDNEIDISDVYVEPNMEKEIKDSSIPEPGHITTIPLNGYSDIFANNKTRFKRICILGNMGSGKTAFCKMMIANWCHAEKRQISDNENKTSVRTLYTRTAPSNVCDDLSANCACSDDDLVEMLKFEFLFFLPLRRLSGHTDIREMVEHYYKNEVPCKEILDDVLQNTCEGVLIIADGVDEWTTGHCEQLPEHMTRGLPYVGGMKQATLIMTSRQSAPGILAMKSTDCDQKILLRGIKGTSTEMLVRKYLSKLTGQTKALSSLDTITKSLKKVKIHKLEQTPLLLQQIVWLLNNGSRIGDSVSEIYSSLLNVAIKWVEGKSQERQSTSSDESFKYLRLPKQVEKYFDCKNNYKFIFALGKIAFELLVELKGSEMTFGRTILFKSGITDKLLADLLKTGMLLEDNCFDPTNEKTHFSFQNTPFLEYFVALYITSIEPDKDVSSDKTSTSHLTNILDNVFRKYSSIQDVLQLGNVLVLACGLDPHIIHKLCDYIYEITSREMNCSEHRYASQYTYDTINLAWNKKIRTLQELVFQCVSECRLNDDSFDQKVRLAAVVIINDAPDMLQYVDPKSVLHVSLCSCQDGEIFTITEFCNLERIHIQHFNLQHKTIVELCQFISNTRSLKLIHFKDIACRHHQSCNCTINLSQHRNLQHLNCEYSEIICLKDIDTACLEHCATNRTDVLQQLIHPRNSIIYMLQCSFLTLCASNRNVLLRQSVCCRRLNTLILYSMKLDHNDLSQLIKVIKQFVSLRTLDINEIECDEPNSYVLDLAGCCHLQILIVTQCNCLTFANVTQTKFELCKTDSTDLIYIIKKSRSLRKLEIINIEEFTADLNDSILTLYQLQELELRLGQGRLHEDVLEITQEMNNLKYIGLHEVVMTESTWFRFVDSLLKLSQPVTVYRLCNFTESERAYVKNNRQNYTMLIDSDLILSFKTVKEIFV